MSIALDADTGTSFGIAVLPVSLIFSSTGTIKTINGLLYFPTFYLKATV